MSFFLLYLQKLFQLKKRYKFHYKILRLYTHSFFQYYYSRSLHLFLKYFLYFIIFRTVWLYGIGISILKTMSVFAGLLMYAKYVNCDPFTSGQVSKSDQLLPYYVMDVAIKVPGLSGLFIAGVVSAALR